MTSSLFAVYHYYVTMPRFSYALRLPDGSTEHGIIDAPDVLSARAALAEMSGDIIELMATVPPIEKTHTPPPSPPWHLVDEKKADKPKVKNVPPSVKNTAATYVPVTTTIRLYAGWLLAWYFLIYAFGSYQFTKALPFEIPYLDEFFLSPTILSFTFAAFLFLLLSSVHTLIGKGLVKGILLIVLGAVLVIVFRQNV
ncbi:MAG: hypothetical protein JWM56_73 [Candidatus Peribacteria bacterium]|nr:hypothetical protein [Candidatus Peribacteria bacterium]